MPKYFFEKRIPSCFVEKKLLKALENYILQKAKNKFSDREDIHKKYSFIIKDSYGKEEFKSVDDFKLEYFSGDTKEISLKFAEYYPKYFKISVVFSLNGYSSTLEIEIEDKSCREEANGIYSEIMLMLKSYKNINFIFHIMDFNYFVGFVMNVFFGALIGISGYGIGIFLASKMQTVQVSLFFGIFPIFYWISAMFKPYSTFETRKNLAFSYYYRWFNLAFLGFLIFGIFGDFIKKKILKM